MYICKLEWFWFFFVTNFYISTSAELTILTIIFPNLFMSLTAVCCNKQFIRFSLYLYSCVHVIVYYTSCPACYSSWSYTPVNYFIHSFFCEKICCFVSVVAVFAIRVSSFFSTSCFMKCDPHTHVYTYNTWKRWNENTVKELILDCSLNHGYSYHGYSYVLWSNLSREGESICRSCVFFILEHAWNQV